jgi:hypothetical protein
VPAVLGLTLSILALLGASLNTYAGGAALLFAFILSGIGMNATINGKSGRALGIAGLIISIFALLANLGVTFFHGKS